MIFDEIKNNIQLRYPSYYTLPWWTRLFLWIFGGKEKEIFELYNTEVGEINIWYSIVEYQEFKYFKKFGKTKESGDKVRFTKLKEREIEVPISMQESEKIRSRAQQLQLENNELFSKIQQNNIVIQGLVKELSLSSTMKTVKVIEEYDTELRMITVYFNGQSIETRPMTDEEFTDATNRQETKKIKQPQQYQIQEDNPYSSPYDDVIDPDSDDMSLI